MLNGFQRFQSLSSENMGFMFSDAVPFQCIASI